MREAKIPATPTGLASELQVSAASRKQGIRLADAPSASLSGLGSGGKLLGSPGKVRPSSRSRPLRRRRWRRGGRVNQRRRGRVLRSGSHRRGERRGARLRPFVWRERPLLLRPGSSPVQSRSCPGHFREPSGGLRRSRRSESRSEDHNPHGSL